jgi:hypothetical protein
MVGRSMKTILTAAIAVLALAGPAAPLDVLTGQNRAILPDRARVQDLQVLENRQIRREFQLQQRFNRELDRRSLRQQRVNPEVPRMQPSCQIDASGSKWARACR